MCDLAMKDRITEEDLDEVNVICALFLVFAVKFTNILMLQLFPVFLKKNILI